jgi:hypothetical protein
MVFDMALLLIGGSFQATRPCSPCSQLLKHEAASTPCVRNNVMLKNLLVTAPPEAVAWQNMRGPFISEGHHLKQESFLLLLRTCCWELI